MKKDNKVYVLDEWCNIMTGELDGMSSGYYSVIVEYNGEVEVVKSRQMFNTLIEANAFLDSKKGVVLND